MGRKRLRETVNVSTSSEHALNKTAVIDGSRLKKTKVSNYGNVDNVAPLEPSREARAAEIDSALSHLTSSIDSFLEQTLESRLRRLPESKLIFAIQDVFRKVPVPTIISRLGKLPRVLLIALRKGVDESDMHSGSSLQAIVNCLVILASGAEISIPEQDPGVRTRRSAFHSAKENFSLMELQAASKAGKWALKLLTDCARGDTQDPRVYPTPDEPSSTKHGNTSSVFVSPRDVLDRVMTGCYSKNIIEGINEVTWHSELSAFDKARVLRTTCEKICHLPRPELYVPILQTCVTGMSRLDTGLAAGRSEVFCEMISDESVIGIMKGAVDSIFNQMSKEARLALLHISEGAWAVHMQMVRDWFCNRHVHSVKEERGVVGALATSAAENVDRYWDLLDEVRNEISGDREPFSTRVWRHYEFVRAVLSEANDVVLFRAQKSFLTYGESCPCAPLHLRFPLRLRPLVRAMSSLAGCWKSALHNINAGPVGISAVYNLLRLSLSLNVSPNMHACLIGCEGMLGRLCWCAGYAILSGSVQVEDQKETYRMFDEIGGLVAVLDLIRVPGGDSAESDKVLRKRAGDVSNSLQEMYRKKKFPEQGSREWKLNGLLASTMCGMACASGMSGGKKFVKGLDEIEGRAFERAVLASLEASEEDDKAHGRAMRLEKDIKGKQGQQ